MYFGRKIPETTLIKTTIYASSVTSSVTHVDPFNLFMLILYNVMLSQSWVSHDAVACSSGIITAVYIVLLTT